MTEDRSRAPGESRASGQNVSPAAMPDVAVLRRTAAGWSVGDEDVPDLTCAMVLADLIAAELPGSAAEPSGLAATARGTGADAGVASDGAAGRDAAADGAPDDSAAGDGGGHEEARRLRGIVKHAI